MWRLYEAEMWRLYEAECGGAVTGQAVSGGVGGVTRRDVEGGLQG